jgi:hypothetical protein
VRIPQTKYEIDGRPTVAHIDTGADELLAELVRVFGWEYAIDLLKDAAMRDAAEQAAKRKRGSNPNPHSMKEACYADFV